MLSPSCALARTARLSLSAGAFILAGSIMVPLVATKAEAQAAGCGDIQKFLIERKSIAGGLSPKKGQQLDARVACTGFGKLVSNGSTLIKWVDTNKDWCQIPDNFVSGIKADHERATAIRAKACGIAANQVQMEKQARQQSGGGGGGLLGGPGLEGQMRVPQGAL
jgi:hypothetical protein